MVQVQVREHKNQEVSRNRNLFFVIITAQRKIDIIDKTGWFLIFCITGTKHYPRNPTILWTEVDFNTVCPQKHVFSWTGKAQSMLREPLGVARAACFEELAGHRQLRCPALCKDLCKSEDKERYIPDTSELRSERLYFRIE